MSKGKLRFALVGCGRIAPRHADALKHHINSAELVAVCDLVASKAEHIGKRYQASYYTDYDEMLSRHEVDVVSILTESGNHAKHCVDIVNKHRKHIIVEKPMALSLPDADAMITACQTQGKKLFVVKQNRYNLPVIQLKKEIESGRFGRLVMGTVRVRWCRTQEYYDQDTWRGTKLLDGGVFTNQASHHIDLLEWMLGEPVSVFAKAKSFLVDIESEDTGVAVITFKNGTIGIVEATTATRPVDLEGSLSILGEFGSVVIGGFAVNQILTWQFTHPRPHDETTLTKYNENPPNVYGFGHIRYLDDVINSIVNHTKPPVDGIEGRKSLELIKAIYQSVELKREVEVGIRS